jgi:hypothetical protein
MYNAPEKPRESFRAKRPEVLKVNRSTKIVNRILFTAIAAPPHATVGIEYIIPYQRNFFQ